MGGGDRAKPKKIIPRKKLGKNLAKILANFQPANERKKFLL
jgi:hypothetical protein